jgi:hypothetical protein
MGKNLIHRPDYLSLQKIRSEETGGEKEISFEILGFRKAGNGFANRLGNFPIVRRKRSGLPLIEGEGKPDISEIPMSPV